MKNWDPYYYPYVTPSIAKKKVLQLSPPAVLFLGFVALIIIGSLLLKLPIATTSTITWMQSIFTATSAVTVTGLVVIDTGTQFTHFGQIVIAILIQAGGLGFMTFAILAAISLGAKIDIGKQIIAQEALGQTSLDKLFETAKYVVIYSIIIELIGIFLLTVIWWDDYNLGKAIYHAFFYSISAFNNAGFALDANGLMAFRGDLWVNIVITSLFIIGGIGFTVLIDIKNQHRWHCLSLNTRLILLATFIVNLFAFFTIWALEANNNQTLANLSWGDQAIAAWFQAVTPRTAGFNTLPIDGLTDSSTTLMLLLMFIGGGSLSTASGIKLGTFVVLIMATYNYLQRRNNVTIMKRTIPRETVMKALALSIISMLMIFIGIFTLTVTEDADFLDIAFEVVSALGTVGLSRGLTSELSAAGEIVIIFLMLVGRIGPLSFAYLIASPNKKHTSYAKTQIQIG